MMLWEPGAQKKNSVPIWMQSVCSTRSNRKGRQTATPEEQAVLSRYVGWGGLQEAFEERNEAWSDEFIELYTELDPDEYKAARESTLNAFYTPPVVIKAMYEALENMGLEKGNVLEPSCGIGNFLGLVPEGMDGLSMYGVELDSISGRIAKLPISGSGYYHQRI